MNINPNELDRFRKDFKEAMAPLQDKYDITISLGNITYTADEFYGKMTVKNSRDKEEIERKDFDRDVWKYEHLGFEAGMYRRIFVGANGKRYAIIGFNTRSKKYPLRFVDISDVSIRRGSAGFVREIVNEYYSENILLNNDIEDEEE